jgi:hypothetical protein
VSQYIVNPRRGPRAPSRCAALVNAPGAAWNTETEDIGPTGCQLVAPTAMARGVQLKLVFSNPRVHGPLKVEGTVAWGSSQPPWRVGVAFADSSGAQAQSWFAQLMAAYPGLGGFLRRIPERLPIDAMLFLSPPPTMLLDFTPEEVDVLRHVASGTTIASLRSRLASNWNASQRAVFSLMARGMVTLSRSAAAHPSAWNKVMEELEAEFVIELPRIPRPMPFLEKAAAAAAPLSESEFEFVPAPEPTPPPEPAAVEAPAEELAADPGEENIDSAIEEAMAKAAAAPDPGGPTAGTGWRGGARHRSREAQESFDLGRMELTAGRINSALAHLRRALQLAPGDPEIAAEIGRAVTGAST